MRHLLLIFALAAAPADAGTYTADAFGLVPGAGETDVRDAWSGLRSDDDATSTVPPGSPERILIVVGPKSIVAGKDEGHAVALVVDRLGNPVADGTPVRFVIGTEIVDVLTRDGIADHLFQAPPLAQEIIVGASTADRQSTRAMVRVVPDIGSIRPELARTDVAVPHEAFFEVETSDLRDRYGNAAEDGTAVTVTLRHANGSHSQATAAASKGAASARFLSRDIAGATSVDAALGRNRSPAGALSIASPRPLGLPEAILTPLPDIDAMRFAIGPFMTDGGHALPDGAPVVIEVAGSDGRTHSVSTWMRDGYASAMLPVPDVTRIETLSVTSPLGRMELDGRLADAALLEVME